MLRNCTVDNLGGVEGFCSFTDCDDGDNETADVIGDTGLKQNQSYKSLKQPHKNQSSGFPTRFATNWSVQPQKMARSLRFLI